MKSPAPAVQVEQSDAPILTWQERAIKYGGNMNMTYESRLIFMKDEIADLRAALAAQLPRIRHLEHERDHARAAIAGRAPVSGALLPALAEDDEVVFPNDAGLAVIHAERYWNLRGCEDVCAALGAKPVSDAPELQQAQLEAARNEAYPVPDSSHASVMQRAVENRTAFSRGFKARHTAAGVASSSTPCDLTKHVPVTYSNSAQIVGAMSPGDVEELAEWRRLKDPAVLHASLLRGLPAKLPDYVFRHIAGGEVAASGTAKLQPADNSEVPYLIVFEDHDRENELVIGDWRAAIRFKQISASWNAHLFGKIASNSRDDKVPCYTAAGVAVSVAEQAEPVEYQYRTRADWHKGWPEWDRCTKEQAADYIATPLLHDWHYEVRALVVAAAGTPAILPQKTDTELLDAVQSVISEFNYMDARWLDDARQFGVRTAIAKALTAHSVITWPDGFAPTILPQGGATPTKDQLNEAISEYVRAAEDTMAAQPTNDAGKRWKEARAALDTVIDALFPGEKP